ncbi:MAG: DUF1289 domain-containing protein [Gammaproteobacteria bacterium]
MNPSDIPPASPCIGVCRMHAGRCIGCQRTGAEIAEHGRKVLAWQRAQAEKQVSATQNPSNEPER